MRPRHIVLCTGLLAAAICSAAAQEKKSPLPSHLPLGKEACYGRNYDAAHLASHPKQRVTGFHIFRDFTPDENAESPAYTAGDLNDTDGTDGGIIVGAYVRFRDRPGLFWNGLHCQSDDRGRVRCGIDCDGGGFMLRTRDKSVLVENEGFVVVGGCGASEDEAEMADFVAPGADDKLFRLDPKPVAECRALEDSRKPAWATLGTPLRVRLDTAEAVCFSRRYDAAHLARHPRQTVRRISVHKAAGKRLGPGEFPHYDLTFRAELKNGQKLEKKTSCSADRYAFACTHDAAADTARDFYLSRAGNDHIMLRDRRGALAKMFDAPLGTDDRIFRLGQSADAECEF